MTLYGKAQFFIELHLESRTIVIAIIQPSRLTAEDQLSRPYTNGSFLAPIVIDAKDVECVVGRVFRQHDQIALIDRAQLMDLGFARGVTEES